MVWKETKITQYILPTYKCSQSRTWIDCISRQNKHHICNSLGQNISWTMRGFYLLPSLYNLGSPKPKSRAPHTVNFRGQIKINWVPNIIYFTLRLTKHKKIRILQVKTSKKTLWFRLNPKDNISKIRRKYFQRSKQMDCIVWLHLSPRVTCQLTRGVAKSRELHGTRWTQGRKMNGWLFQ